MKATLTLLAVLLLAPAAALPAGGSDASERNSRLPAFSWERVPVYAHIAKFSGDFTPEEAKFLAARFPLICVSMNHARRQHGSTEDGFVAGTRQIKSADSRTKVLFYWNTFLDYPLYKNKLDARQHPDWRLLDAAGKPILRARKSGTGAGDFYYNLASAGLRDWWTDQAQRMCASGGADGVFMDAVLQAISPKWQARVGDKRFAEMKRGMTELMKLTRQKIGSDKLMICNLIRDAQGEGAQSSELLPLMDGAMIEHFGAFQSSSKENMAADMASTAAAGKQGKIVIFKTWPGFDWMDEAMMAKRREERVRLARERIVFPLACFLAVAQERAYFCYTWGYREEHGTFDWYPEFDRPLGPPRADAQRDGWKFTREFEHASVFVDLEKQVARIDWR